MKVNLLYFAALRDALGSDAETFEGSFHTLQELREILAARGDVWQRLASGMTLAAINQSMAHDQSPLNEGDEVAFFPPVTGG